MRLTWRLAFNSVCLAHRCQLLNTCQSCDLKINLNALNVPNRCPKCDADLTSFETRQIVDSDLFYKFVDLLVAESVGRASRIVLRQTRRDLELALYSKKFTNYIRAHSLRELTLDYASPAESEAVTAILHWLFTLHGKYYPRR